MDGTAITALQTQFTDQIALIETPVLAIMGAGLGISMIFVVYRVLKGALNNSTTAR